MSIKYDFHDDWSIQAPINDVWDAVSDPGSWQKWWPGLSDVEVLSHETMGIGNSAQLTWRSRSGYRLKHRVTVTDIEPGKSITFTSSGDLAGYGSWQFFAAKDQTNMSIDWHVKATKKWMIWLDAFLHGVFTNNHKALMRAGEAGLNDFLR